MHHTTISYYFLLFLFTVSTSQANSQWISSHRKSAFVQHIGALLNHLAGSSNSTNNASSTPAATTTLPATTKAVNSAPVAVVGPNENPAAILHQMNNLDKNNTVVATIAPPAIRPCFVRPSFCPATSDDCSTSRCARLYANGVKIGRRYYRRVKCRLNYCRGTCGKAEWFADGRRLVGCSDSSSTIDNPIWAVERVYSRTSRLDSFVLPSERIASTRPPTRRSNSLGQQPQRRSLGAFFGDIGNKIANKTNEIGGAIQNVFSSKIQAETDANGVEHDVEHKHEEPVKQASSASSFTAGTCSIFVVLVSSTRLF